MIEKQSFVLFPGIRSTLAVSLISVGILLISGTFTGNFNNPASDALAQQITTKPADEPTETLPAGDAAQFIASSWSVNCSPQTGGEKLTCVLSQSITIAKTRELFVAISVRATSDETEAEPYILVARLPHGLALASGVQYRIDEQKPGKLTLHTSNTQGLFARVGLTRKLLSALQKGKQLEIIFNARNGREIVVQMSLQGFAAGFEKLK